MRELAGGYKVRGRVPSVRLPPRVRQCAGATRVRPRKRARKGGKQVCVGVGVGSGKRDEAVSCLRCWCGEGGREQEGVRSTLQTRERMPQRAPALAALY